MGTDEIDDLRKRIDNLQYKELEPLKEKVNDFAVTLERNNTLTDMCIKTNDKMSATLDSVKDTMIKLSDSVTNANKISTQLTENVEKLNNKVDKMEERIVSVDNKGKVDILTTIKENWIRILEAIVSLSVLAYIIGQTIGHW